MVTNYDCVSGALYGDISDALLAFCKSFGLVGNASASVFI
ncbi:hypothetical protein CFter6_0765 [Collimonas fungivorans]|uniref:Uncharacterized protein n=1 Tax=Collimonas fungivorans TaxID=158899 RepID=A0A127P6Q7_9BURK|nr:hypothetical protein CFter6_0765 [Collimonas fungivorans]